MLHWHDILNVSYLRIAIAVSVWDGIIASFTYIFILPLLAIYFHNPLFLFGYILDLPAVAVPVLITARKRGEVFRALTSLPAFVVLRIVNSVFMISAFFMELILRKRLNTYEKGH